MSRIESSSAIVCRSAIVLTLLAAMMLWPVAALARHHRAAPKAAASAEDEGTETAEGKQGLTGPYVAACVMEPSSGAILFEKDMHKQWPPASMTKMMLMLIVAEKLGDGSLKLSDQISTSRKASNMGGSQVYLKEGETFSLDDMMKAIVVHSANDASVAVAEHLGGSTDAFVEMMNRRAHELGLKDTRYSSMHGLPPGPGQQEDLSSAYDSAVLARELIKYPDILRWSSINVAPFRNGTFELRNTNHLVRTYAGCDGLKTGFFYKSGFNVAATAKRNGVRLIAVVLGSPRKHQNFDEAATMMSQGFLNYFMYPVAKKGAAAGQSITVNGGAVGEFKPVWKDDFSIFIKHGDEKSALKIDYDLPSSVAAPIKAGQQLGRGRISVAGKPAGTSDLIAPKDIPRASAFSRLMNKL